MTRLLLHSSKDQNSPLAASESQLPADLRWNCALIAGRSDSTILNALRKIRAEKDQIDALRLLRLRCCRASFVIVPRLLHLQIPYPHFFILAWNDSLEQVPHVLPLFDTQAANSSLLDIKSVQYLWTLLPTLMRGGAFSGCDLPASSAIVIFDRYDFVVRCEDCFENSSIIS